MPERRRKWKILVTVKTVMIQVKVKMKSLVYLMSLFFNENNPIYFSMYDKVKAR